jgi:hypothetical protein
MWQTVLTYAVVVGAGAFVAWTVLLPRSLRARLRHPLRRTTPDGGTCGNCGCEKS